MQINVRNALLATSGLVAASLVAMSASMAVDVGDDAALRAAIFAANTGGDSTINVTGNITLTQSLPMITSDLTVNGGGFTINANNTGRAFFAAAGSVSISNLTIANALAQGGHGGAGTGGGGGGGLGAGAAAFVYTGASLTLNVVQIQNAAAIGGNGGNGDSGGSGGISVGTSVGGAGGGGGGLGGNGGAGLGYSFNAAGGGGGGYAGTGGAAANGSGGGGGGGGEFGAGGTGNVGGGGGGGQRGNGGAGNATVGGGGGGATANGGPGASPGGIEGGAGGGVNSAGSNAAAALGGGGGGGSLSGAPTSVAGGNGLASGGGGGGGGSVGFVTLSGGAGGLGGGGGGIGAGFAQQQNGGSGGAFGGGGGGSNWESNRDNSGASTFGGAGGYGAGGGGGGGQGGSGGLGGGNGGGALPNSNLLGGGNGGIDGGGGAAFGGAVFVASGGALTITDGGFAGTYAVTAGSTRGQGGATAGTALGRVMFLEGSAIAAVSMSSGSALTIAGDGAIAGTGSLVVSGLGTVSFTGSSPNYFGAVTVAGGTLVVYSFGSLLGMGAINVNAGATLSLTGSGNNAVTVDLGGRLVGTGGANSASIFGTLAPGNSIGTLSLGTLTLGPTATYEVEVSPSAADRTNVSGVATISGAHVHATFQAGTYTSRSYTILSAGGGRVGTFAALTSVNLPQHFTAALAYTATDVQLNLTLRLPTVGALFTERHRRVGAAIEAGFHAGGTLSGGLAHLATLSQEQMAVPLNALAGEIGTGGQNPSFAIGGQFFGAMQAQGQSWRAGGSGGGTGNAGLRVELASAQPEFELAQLAPGGRAPSASARRWTAWSSGFGLGGSRDGDAAAGSARLSYAMGGGAVGIDVAVSPQLLLGAAIGGAASNFSYVGQSSSGDSRTVTFGVYGSWTTGPFYVDGALSYGHARFSTSRTVTVGSVTDRATASFGGNQFGAQAETGWRRRFGIMDVTPFAGLAVQALWQNAYSETAVDLATNGPGTMGLSFKASAATSVRSQLGGEVATTFRVGDRVTVTPRLRIAWAHEFVTDRQVNASFQTLPGSTFAVEGARPARDAAIVGAGVDIGFARNIGFFARFDGDLAPGGSAFAGSGGLRIAL